MKGRIGLHRLLTITSAFSNLNLPQTLELGIPIGMLAAAAQMVLLPLSLSVLCFLPAVPFRRDERDSYELGG